jgi:hypothetical protein
MRHTCNGGVVVTGGFDGFTRDAATTATTTAAAAG